VIAARAADSVDAEDHAQAVFHRAHLSRSEEAEAPAELGFAYGVDAP
jgi:hypothetical protein